MSQKTDSCDSRECVRFGMMPLKSREKGRKERETPTNLEPSLCSLG
jgi:hypothetical protein